jgi:hypothetical protein
MSETTLPPRMTASCYLHWTLRAFAYLGSTVWRFAAGTGVTVIAPLYLVLKARGVKTASRSDLSRSMFRRH